MSLIIQANLADFVVDFDVAISQRAAYNPSGLPKWGPPNTGRVVYFKNIGATFPMNVFLFDASEQQKYAWGPIPVGGRTEFIYLKSNTDALNNVLFAYNFVVTVDGADASNRWQSLGTSIFSLAYSPAVLGCKIIELGTLPELGIEHEE